jgi:hypothetical protein
MCTPAEYDGNPFLNQNTLGRDACATAARNHTNTSILEYQTWNSWTNACGDAGGAAGVSVGDPCSSASLEREKQVMEFGLRNHNLRYKNGVGLSPCHIDVDNDLRLNQLWNKEKAKSQMFTRFYTAHPNLARGKLEPEVEDKLLQGDDTGRLKPCLRLDESAYDRFIPLLPCLQQQLNDPDTKVQPFNPVGEDSRQMMRDMQPKFERCASGGRAAPVPTPSSHLPPPPPQ